MTFPWRSAIAACVLPVLIGPARAPAQPLFHGDVSLDCTVINADMVFIGTVAKVVKGPEVVAVMVDVEETLKGEHRDRRSVRLPAAPPALARGRDRDRPLRVLVAANGDPQDGARIIDLSGEGLEVLAADFTVLRPEDVVRAAKAVIRGMPGVRRIETFTLVVPPGVAAGTRWEKSYGSGGYVTLSVPVDERLEERAIRAISSRSYRDREEGARALRFFKSAENAARAKPLLADPGWAYLMHAEENLGRELRVYGVREAAYETLAYWGVKADRPMTREELWKPERVRLVDFSNRRASDADLDGLARFPNLEALHLLNEPLTDARLEHLVRLRSLRTLELGGTAVTDAGLKVLAGLEELRNLGLRGTRVTGAGLRDLAALEKLASLDLSQTGVTDAALDHLAGLSGLRELDLGGTNVSADAVARLLELRPDLKVRPAGHRPHRRDH